MIEVAVRDDHRVDVEQRDVLLEVRQRPRAGVEPDVEPLVAEQVPAGGLSDAAPAPAGAEDHQLHARALLRTDIPGTLHAPGAARLERDELHGADLRPEESRAD